MHISTTALYVIFLSILERSKSAHAFENGDAFGPTNYGYKCFDRLYPLHVIYATANHVFANKKATINYINFETHFYHNIITLVGKYYNIDKLGKPIYFGLFPIFSDGTIYPFDLKPENRLTKSSTGEMVEIDPGLDRLVVDINGNIKTAITELINEEHIKTDIIQECEVIKSLEEFRDPPPA
ncbi:hypothetical protein OnM2_05545 [Erysiphe neolycopersici]|uniref:Uncharacterized protein n=1 Tax=Erysiphe neolycopersici TaxID=212602 RepID=A0A420I2E9_9PEZI|nr:hypothetical protein OnM2_05545 [Erysiphe neolycopersici]